MLASAAGFASSVSLLHTRNPLNPAALLLAALLAGYTLSLGLRLPWSLRRARRSLARVNMLLALFLLAAALQKP